MKHKCAFISTLFLLITLQFNAQTKGPYFTLKPTLTPDSNFIIFSYEGDLWKVVTTGGNALRLTAMQGNETNPSISPNGKWLTFSSDQFGNRDVYIMPLNGGEIKQLTFHESNDDVSSWSWDNSKIYFTSNRSNSVTTYSVNKDGGTPERLFDHYFNTVHNVVEHPSNNEIYFNESWESGIFAHRKRYKGDYNPDIKSFNKKTKEFKKHTSYRGKDFAITFDKNGKSYFISDEANGEYNLYTFDENGSKKQLTKFETSIMWPKVSANGDKVVFRKDYQIFIYDVATGKTVKPKINIFKNNTLNKKQSYNVKGEITYFDISPDEEKIAFVSRGKLFVSDIKGTFIKEIRTNSNEAVEEVKWLKNNKTLLFSQSIKGYYNWFSINADSNTKEKQHSKAILNSHNLTLNSDRTKGVYVSGRNEIRIIDLENFKSNVIVTDELWGFSVPSPHFSPDDKYVIYNVKRNFEYDILAYNIASKTSINLTNTKVSEDSPIWSPDGKYIYFSSDRLNPSYPFGTTNSKIYQMALDKFDAPFKIEKYNSLFEEKKDEKDTDKDKKETKEKPVVKINPNGLMDRLKSISPSFGKQSSPSIIKKEAKTYILYISNHSEGKTQLWKTTLEPFEKNKTEQVSDKKIWDYQLVSSKKNNYLLVSGSINTLDIASNKLKEIDLNYKFNKSLSKEFVQMYYEAWAGMEENFYNENFHGQNWQKLRDQYASYLPYVTSRASLRLIFNDMLGELNTSHFGFSSSGKEEKLFYETRTIGTGILFDNNNPYVVNRIVKDGPTDITGKNIRKGDKLIAINSVIIDPKENREKYFAAPSTKNEITLTFRRNQENFNVNIHPTSNGSIRTLLYDEWQDKNQHYVDSKSKNRIAYVHMKNMTGSELTKFKADLMTKESDKEALILDLRYNTGGNVHDAVLKFLSQKSYLNWKYREGKLTSQSNFNYGNKPIVLLINEQSLSDAEMTAAGFKELALGTIIGTETYRWIVFTSGKSLVDGSFYRLPAWGCYTLDGKNLETNGVSPDIYIHENFKDRLQGNQPQLNAAINHIMKELNK